MSVRRESTGDGPTWEESTKEGPTRDGSTLAIRTEGLTQTFGPLVAVDGLSLEVATGEFFGLVGPDGAGKTTTLRMLAGVLAPSSGRAWVFGTDVGEDPEAVKTQIAYMSQRFGLYHDLTVGENLDFYADLFGVPRDQRPERLAPLYEFSGLGPYTDRLADELSGGMKQKLGLSCALIHRPSLLLLDEPTFGVDPISRRDLWLIIHEMVDEGVTVVVSTSYMDEAERFDRLAFLQAGRSLSVDTPDALRKGLAGRLLSVRVGNRSRAARDVLRTTPFVASASLFGDRLHVVLEDAMTGRGTTGQATTGRDLVQTALESKGFSDVDVETIDDPSLEDVFIDQVDVSGDGVHGTD